MTGPTRWADSAVDSAPADRSAPVPADGSASASSTRSEGDTGVTAVDTDAVNGARADDADDHDRAGRASGPATAGSVGQEEDAGTESEERAEREETEQEEKAREIVLKQLALQPRSKAELERALRRRGVPDEVAEKVLGRFSEVGLIDDAAFAQAWVETRHAGRGLARRALAHELRRRGVDDQDIGRAVRQVSDDTEVATARALVARRLPSTRRLRPHVRIRRLLTLLARKGYSSAVAVQVVRDTLADSPEDVRLLEEIDPASFGPDDEF